MVVESDVSLTATQPFVPAVNDGEELAATVTAVVTVTTAVTAAAVVVTITAVTVRAAAAPVFPLAALAT